MEGNDILPFDTISQATMFEGVLASPPKKFFSRFKELLSASRQDWHTTLNTWEPHSMPLRSLADCVNRRGIGTDVYTLLPEEAVDAISSWLIKYGITAPVYSFGSITAIRDCLTINRGIHYFYTSSPDDAAIVGLRSTVVSSEAALPI